MFFTSFINCTNGAKSCKASHIINFVWFDNCLSNCIPIVVPKVVPNKVRLFWYTRRSKLVAKMLIMEDFIFITHSYMTVFIRFYPEHLSIMRSEDHLHENRTKGTQANWKEICFVKKYRDSEGTTHGRHKLTASHTAYRTYTWPQPFWVE